MGVRPVIHLGLPDPFDGIGQCRTGTCKHYRGQNHCLFHAIILPDLRADPSPTDATDQAQPEVKLHFARHHAKGRTGKAKGAVMILYPAIDLKDGRAVRLVHGEMARETVFNDNPAAQALEFVNAGCEWLHLVDLNGAFAGEPVNAAPVEAILKQTSVPAQLGGGIRDMATIEHWLENGIRRVILGTVAVREPELVRAACKRFPGRIAVGIDAKGGKVAVEGWAETSELTAIDLAGRFEDAGVAAIIYTDIDRDGILAGLNLPATLALAEAVSIPVIASGGLASMADIDALLEPQHAILEGAISGRALYDGRIDVPEALRRIKAARPTA